MDYRRGRDDGQRQRRRQSLYAPNDLIADARGGIYFTDPGNFGKPAAPRAYVYYLPPGQTEPMVIDDQVTRSNAIILTPDGKTLIVSDTAGAAVFAYDVETDGTAEDKRIFTTLREIPAGNASGADGMAVDRTKTYLAKIFFTCSYMLLTVPPRLVTATMTATAMKVINAYSMAVDAERSVANRCAVAMKRTGRLASKVGCAVLFMVLPITIDRAARS